MIRTIFRARRLALAITGGVAVAHHGWGSYDAAKVLP
jgi:hypothetical protein